MHRIVKQIRDIELIEKELTANPAGVLALSIDSEKFTQVATTFLYQDKNIYIFFGADDELYESIHFDARATFTAIKYGKAKKTRQMNFEPLYNLFSISVKGIIKKVEEPKIIEDLKQAYFSKYKKSYDENSYKVLSRNVVLIDSEEIQALEEIGG